MDETSDPLDKRVAEEADAAAAEAGAIGGRADPSEDPAERPVSEAGGGEAEGFELAEEDLREHAENATPAVDPSSAAFSPEVEADRETVARGEADEVRSSERTGET